MQSYYPLPGDRLMSSIVRTLLVKGDVVGDVALLIFDW